MNKRKRLLAILINGMLLSSLCVASAVDVTVGATMAFGGGNKADYTLRTSMIGVNNTVTGVRGNQSKDNLAIGVGNTGTKVQHMTVIGSKNTVSVQIILLF